MLVVNNSYASLTVEGPVDEIANLQKNLARLAKPQEQLKFPKIEMIKRIRDTAKVRNMDSLLHLKNLVEELIDMVREENPTL